MLGNEIIAFVYDINICLICDEFAVRGLYCKPYDTGIMNVRQKA